MMKRLNDRFVRIADLVSFGMGTPANIGFWLLVVAIWIGLFWSHTLNETTNLLPGWFTSNAFNFPLNTVTTLAELYIGFLVAAATNRAERHLVGLIEDIRKIVTAVHADEQRDKTMLQAIQSDIAANTELTKAIHELVTEIHSRAVR